MWELLKSLPGVVRFLNWLSRQIDRWQARREGAREEAERQREASDDTLRRVDGAKPDSVSDDEAFGPR